jgi:hypothetical protein
MSEQLLAQLKKEQLALLQSFVDSPAVSFEKYLQRVGEYQGLQKAQDMLLLILQGDDND